MSNDGSGSIDLPFDASAMGKEVEQQTKSAQKMLRDLSTYEGQVKAAIAARNRIMRDMKAQEFMAMEGRTSPWQAMPTGASTSIAGMGASSPWHMPTGARSSIFQMGAHTDIRGMGAASDIRGMGAHTDISGMGASTDISMMGASQRLYERPTRQPTTANERFQEAIARSSQQLEKFSSAGMLATGAALALATVVSTISGIAERGQRANQELGSLQMLSSRAKRALGVENIVSKIGATGDVAGASKFVEAAIQMKNQRQLTIPNEVIDAGLQGIARGTSADDMIGWLNTFQFGQIEAASNSRPTTRGAALEIQRRRRAAMVLLNAEATATQTQRDFGALSDASEYAYEQAFPLLSGMWFGPKQIGKLGWDMTVTRNMMPQGNGGPLGPAGTQTPRGVSPVRQPGYDVTSSGRQPVLQVEIVGDRTGRPNPRSGNQEH